MGAAQAQASLLPDVLAVGYTPFPHSYIEVLPGKVSGLAQFVCIGYIVRKTFGLERKRNTPPPEWTDPITARQFARIAKDANERTIELVLDDAVERGLIARKRAADKRGYVYKALVANWPKAPGYSPKVAPKKPAVSDETHGNGRSAAAEGPEQKAALAAGAKPRLVKSSEALVILPGETSRPIPLSEAVSSLVIRNDSAAELRVPVPLISGESALLSIRAKYPNSDSGSHSDATAGNPNSSSGIASAKNGGSTRTAVRVSSELLARFQSDPRYATIEAKLDPWFDEAYGKGLDTAMICRILERLGEAPAEKYLQLCSTEWDKWTRKRREAPTSGMFLNWADDAKAAEVKRRVRTERERKALEAEERKARITALALCLREQTEPMVSEIGSDWREYIERTIREASPDELLEARNVLDSGEPIQ